MDGDLISRKALLEAIDERERIARKYVPDIQDDELRPTLQSIREFVNNRPGVDAALGRLADEYAQVQAQAEGARDVYEVAKRKEKERHA